MRSRYCLSLILLLFSFLTSACARQADEAPPRLVVLIGVDQFRASYLQEYDQVFTGGFRRLKDQGLWVKEALVDHAPALSYPGHTTLATGVYPRKHGISQNAWIERQEDGSVNRLFVARDTTVHIVDYPNEMPVSPRNVRVTGIADWIREADPESRSVALSTGPSLAMLYGGRAATDRSTNHVYWLSSRNGVFVTSSFYRDRYPDWLETFNNEVLPGYRTSRVWDISVPVAYRSLARRDAAPYEGDGEHTTFPHRYDDVPSDDNPRHFNRWFFNYSPGSTEALFALARESVLNLELGQRSSTDFLAVAIKVTDRVGHDYGPRSLEQLDVVMRLDRELGTFLDFLDETVGADHYVLALSADHGSPNVTEFELEEGRAGHRVTEEEIELLLDQVDSVVKSFAGPEEQIPDLIARELEGSEFIVRAMTPDELGGGGPADETLRAYRNSYIPGLNTTFPLWTNRVLYETVGARHPALYGVIAEFSAQAQLWTARSAHGSAHMYDRLVPAIFFGKDIQSGIYQGDVMTIDIAPTLSSLGGVVPPVSVDGRILDIR